MNTQTKITTAVPSASNAEERVTALDWQQISQDLDRDHFPRRNVRKSA